MEQIIEYKNISPDDFKGQLTAMGHELLGHFYNLVLCHPLKTLAIAVACLGIDSLLGLSLLWSAFYVLKLPFWGWMLQSVVIMWNKEQRVTYIQNIPIEAIRIFATNFFKLFEKPEEPAKDNVFFSTIRSGINTVELGINAVGSGYTSVSTFAAGARDTVYSWFYKEHS